MRAGWFSGACICVDDESLPFAAGDSRGEFVGGDGVVPECLHAPDQYEAPAMGASLWRALQGDRGGGGKLVLGGAGLYSPQSGAGGVGVAGAGAGELQVEQCAGVSGGAAEPAGVFGNSDGVFGERMR